MTAAVYLAAERPDDARRVIADGMMAMRERGARGYQAPLLRLEAEVLLHDGEAALARQRVEEALATAVELGMSPEVARCHATLAKATRVAHR